MVEGLFVFSCNTSDYIIHDEMHKECKSCSAPPATTNFIWVVYRGSVYLCDSDYIIHMLKMRNDKVCNDFLCVS